MQYRSYLKWTLLLSVFFIFYHSLGLFALIIALIAWLALLKIVAPHIVYSKNSNIIAPTSGMISHVSLNRAEITPSTFAINLTSPTDTEIVSIQVNRSEFTLVTKHYTLKGSLLPLVPSPIEDLLVKDCLSKGALLARINTSKPVYLSLNPTFQLLVKNGDSMLGNLTVMGVLK